ncbi:TadE/TadG family type IV pilus assembly protein [Syntrophomonas palmitatica]|uniref:TadE/TadG family type IV pilus assembly protein n=1 Tax=Syntrophomonas palmitatica TaxID=402877 RepID=UPI0006CFBE1B|nr:Tad domain-containing protein [Syntrophomonas palmitatica]
MKLWRRLIFSDKGNAAVFVALAMVVFAGFASLVTDAGLIYLNRARMANALDSAVLAAAQDLPAKPDVSLGVADQYAGLNGLSDEEAGFVLDNDNRRIGGAATRQLTLGFARLLGFDRAKVKAQSKAKVIPVSSVYGVVPFGVLEGDFNYGEEIILKQGSGDNLYHGWFGALILGRNGADLIGTI